MSKAELNRPLVVYWFNQPTPYVVSRFNALSQREEFRFEAWFSETRQADRSWDVDESSWRFSARYIPERRISGVKMRVPLPELRERRPDLFVLEYDRINLALGLVAGTAAAQRVALRVLPNFDAWSKRTWWRECAKHLFFRAVDAAKVPGTDGRALATKYGLPESAAHRVTQSVDVLRLARALQVMPSQRAAQRRALGLEGVVLIFVGRLWSGKGVDEVIEAYRRLRADDAPVSLLIVGDGVDELRYRAQASGLSRVHFAGFVQPADIARWYALADVLIFPTHGDPNGLVIDEAMAAGLSVICSDAAGDVRERVTRDVGRVVPVGDVPRLVAAIRDLIRDPTALQTLKRNAAISRRSFDDGHYAADFTRFVTSTCSHSTRSTLARRLLRVAGGVLLSIPAARRPPGVFVGVDTRTSLAQLT